MREYFFTTDTQSDVVESLEAALECSNRVIGDPQKWKWFVIALHSAAQGAMVLVLERGNGLQALSERSREKWLKANEAREPLPEVFLNYFMELYADIKTDAALPYVHSEKFRAEKHHDASMNKLNDLRKNWVHFAPKTWTIERQYVAKTSLPVLEVISFLLLSSNAFFWNEPSLEQRARSLLMSLDSALKEIEAHESTS